MGKKLFLIFNIGFIMLIGMMLYQAFRIYLMKESINTEIIMLEEKVNEYADKKKNLQNKIDNFSEEEKIESAVENQQKSMWKEIFAQGIWKNNPAVVQLLGLCPLLNLLNFYSMDL